MSYGSDADVDALLAKKTWAIIGLSNNTERPAYEVAALLQGKGHRIIPVHPSAETVHGERGYATLDQVPDEIDVVDFFLNATASASILDLALSRGVKGVWYQLGVVDEAAYTRARDAGAIMVMDRCPAIEYRKR